MGDCEDGRNSRNVPNLIPPLVSVIFVLPNFSAPEPIPPSSCIAAVAAIFSLSPLSEVLLVMLLLFLGSFIGRAGAWGIGVAKLEIFCWMLVFLVPVSRKTRQNQPVQQVFSIV
jgi:hypothetical protein